MKKNKKGLVLSILAIISLMLITAGVTYAFFNYAKEGTTDNVITTGTITFLYTEVSGVGNGISIENAFPVSDEVGKAQTGEGNVFDFKVTSTTPNNASIPYEVTARKSSDSDDIDEYIRVYLTKVSGTTEEEVLLDNYSNLVQTSVSVPDGTVEKTIYTGEVPANSTNYEQDFRLRMWIDEDTDFSDGSMNSKTFTLTVNVYANAKVVSDSTSTTLTLKDAILAKYSVIEDEPTLTDSSNNTSDASGLYASTKTNTGNPTYYFRGDVDNTVEFAGQTWNVVRINEDGTVRLIMADGINHHLEYKFNPTNSDYTYMYYSESAGTTAEKQGAKYILDNWYNTNIASNESYASKVVTGDYFCEEAKVKASSVFTSGNATMEVYSSYEPTFECSTDGNSKGIVNASVGLITYDEAVYAGAYYNKANSSYYLYSGTYFWTMSPLGVDSYPYAFAWVITSAGNLRHSNVGTAYALRPVLILKADTPVTESETGTSVWTVVE